MFWAYCAVTGLVNVTLEALSPFIIGVILQCRGGDNRN